MIQELLLAGLPILTGGGLLMYVLTRQNKDIDQKVDKAVCKQTHTTVEVKLEAIHKDVREMRKAFQLVVRQNGWEDASNGGNNA